MSGTLIFAGGGTGGHVYPMLAIASEVKRLAPDVRLVFVGTSRGIEVNVVPAAGFELELLDVQPLRGGGIAQAWKGAYHAAKSLPLARDLVRRLAPQALLSVGGYASGPVALAAWSASVPVALVEPNSAIGLANRLIARLVRRAYTAFDESARYFTQGSVLRTGVPIRGGFEPSPYEPKRPLRVLLLGGSQGAKALNEAVPRALLEVESELSMVHQCGRAHEQAVRALYSELGLTNASIRPYIDDMPRALAEADLVIGRAGASAVAEICAVGRPSLLVPGAFGGDHQRHNAEALEAAGASVCVLNAEATPARLAQEIDRLASDRDRLTRMAAAARGQGRPEASRSIAEDLLALSGLSNAGAKAPPDPASSDSAASRSSLPTINYQLSPDYQPAPVPGGAHV
jgi:UDP-N-acetylglucosamine--N-acetylmuramyl-(pentapeptide) pyrophosphoryl-undecaprenol N-acetylglucosamine transferase